MTETEYDECMKLTYEHLEAWLKDDDFKKEIVKLLTDLIWNGCDKEMSHGFLKELAIKARDIDMYEGEI